jgi:hypothetical protein
MSKVEHRQAGTVFFWLAVFIWLLATFPCVHLHHLYIRNHLPGSVQSHPELFTAYLRRAIWATTALGILGPALLWLVPARLKREGAVFFWGGAIGIATAAILWSIVARAFGWVSDKPLGAGTFLYSGLLAGIVASELNRKTISARWGMVRKPSELKRDFQVASLMIWAVLLKAIECEYFIDAQPGKVAGGLHLAMFFAVLLWSPWVSRFFWNHRPRSLLSSVLRSSAAGMLFPPLSAIVLYLPVMVLFFAGIPVAYAMLWGGIIFLRIHPWWLHALVVSPGLIWGVIVGLLRWQYLQLEMQILLHSDPTNK